MTLYEEVRAVLVSVQHQMFDLGGELCIPGHAAIFDADIQRLEDQLDAFNADLPPLKDFILPGVAWPPRTATWPAPSAGAPNARR